ncbi:hypothetical protein ACQ4PT_047767 [Festuca glaucescens]
MCELYPYLAEEVKGLEAAHPGMCKREFKKMDDDKARAMDEKIKRQRLLQIKLEMHRANLTKEGKTLPAKYNILLDDSKKHKVVYEVHRLVFNQDPELTNSVEVVYAAMYGNY